MIRWLFLILLWLGPSAGAQDYVSVPNAPLNDTDFYNLVSCAAAPDGPCAKSRVRWPEEMAGNLSLGIVAIHQDYPRLLRTPIRRALYRAITEVNAADAGLRLRRAAPDEKPDIAIHLVDQKMGSIIRDFPEPELNGNEMPAALFWIWWNGRDEIQRAVILFARDVKWEEIESIMLEEVVQATGLMTDIDSPWYRFRSIFAELSDNTVTRLQPQDIMALRRHYPPQ
ncbi:hypothetical protein [uncultured Roseobacter sp.]|uniref:hypothetical protein n=1 Tax=uncultured Roseobacter sp. TaxID=114847 RepID=UPI002604397E|nr:hypothetical protein [uncultured Roseobacter sp.]